MLARRALRLEIGVQPRAENSDGRTDSRLSADTVAKGKNGKPDHENALADIAHGVSDGLHLLQRLISDLQKQRP